MPTAVDELLTPGLVRGGSVQVTTGVAVCMCSHRYVVGWTVGWKVSSPWWSSILPWSWSGLMEGEGPGKVTPEVVV